MSRDEGKNAIEVFCVYRYMYHYVSEEDIIYLCITDDVSCVTHDVYV